MDIASFLPEYPAISSGDFYQEIYDREEFRELKLTAEETVPTEPGQLMRHQKIPQRYLSVFTVFDRMLLVWEMGAGKTCAAIGISEGVFAQPEFGIQKAVYLARSKDLYDKFMHALATQCTAGQYLPEERRIKYSDQSWLMARNRLIRKRYRCETYYIFCERELWNVSDEKIRRNFSNHVFIFDEIHNLRDSRKPGKRSKSGRYTLSTGDLYNSLFRLLSVAENVKVVFLSGTPMTNSVDEIGSVFRLLTGDTSIPSAREFAREYMAENDDGVLEVRDDKLAELQEIFRGRVSYLRAVNIPTVFEGSILPGFQQFSLYPDSPSDFQLQAYSEAYAADTASGIPGSIEPPEEDLERSGVFNNSREAALMVFPDGSWGSRGYDTYIKQKTAPLLPENPTVEDVYRLSAKYGMVLEQLLAMRNGEIPRRKIFIFCKYVNGSGLRAFGEILKKFGIESTTSGRLTTTADRFSIVTSSAADNKDPSAAAKTNKIISAFNNPNNVTGERLWVLMGTEKIAEGYDLYDCDICHIFTPHWNYSETEQAIARIKRMGRHAGLEALQGERVTVKVYQHCFVTPGDSPPSIDLKMYGISEKKDIAIAKMRRILKESAVDCQLTFARNYVGDETDNSRECDYTQCEYTCNGITDPFSTEINENTWQLYYANTEGIKQLLTALLAVKFTVTIPEALSFIRAGTYVIPGVKVTVHALLRVAADLIETAEPVVDLYGFTGYVAVEGDRLFLTPNPFGNALNTDAMYLSSIPVNAPVDIPRYLIPDIYIQLLTVRTLSDSRRSELLSHLPILAREKLLEDIVLSRRLNPRLNNPGREALYQLFSEFIIEDPLQIVSTMLYDRDTRTGLRCLPINGTVWEDCEAENIVPDEISEAAIRNNPLGFYGKMETSKGKTKFKIVERDGSKTGRVCTTITPNILEKYCEKLDIKSTGTRAEVCIRIRQELETRGLVATVP